MLQIRQSPATAAVTTEHPVATVGRYLVRYALVVVIAWIGALKYGGIYGLAAICKHGNTALYDARNTGKFKLASQNAELILKPAPAKLDSIVQWLAM